MPPMTPMPTSIRYSNPNHKLDKLTEAEFEDHFFECVNSEMNSNPEAWEDSRKIFGTICEKIQKSNNEKDCVSVPIEDENDIDGGYIHVFGWAEVIKGDVQ